MSFAARARRTLRVTLTYAAIIGATLLLVDGVCIALGLFPPSYDYGDPDIGWRPAPATGHMAIGRCVDFSTGRIVTYQRNEDGVRVDRMKAQLAADSLQLLIAVTGDSHTDLCSSNAQLHSGVLESRLAASGLPVTVLSYGAGRYSPLQDYLAFRTVLRPYHPGIFILNVYTGNDFYDLLRADDRPHFVASDSGYRIAPPIWYSLEDPSIQRRSRVAFAARKLGDKLGLRQIYFRVSELRRLGAQEGKGIPTVVAYMRDLLKAREPTLGYPDALAAQMLNQQLFFQHFPASQDESLRRMRALMEMIRRENPDLLLVLSPLPSYELVGEQPIDTALVHVLGRLPVTLEEGRQQELQLYRRLEALAGAESWIFVDNLAALQVHSGPERLFNDFDYHLLPAASALIGEAQAAALFDTLAALTRRHQSQE